MKAPHHITAALFMGLEEPLRRAFFHDASFDQAIETLKQKIAVLERCRDRGIDPKTYKHI